MEASAAQVVDGRAAGDNRQPRRQARPRRVVAAQQAEVAGDEADEDILRHVVGLLGGRGRVGAKRSPDRGEDHPREPVDERLPRTTVARQAGSQVERGRHAF